MQNAAKMIKTAGFMIAATLLAKIFGLLRDMFIAAFYATGTYADAFFAATKIPLLFFDLVIGGVISAAFIPVFNEYLQLDGKRRALEFANRFINLILVITGIICALGVLFPQVLINIITPNISYETKLLASSLTRIMFPMIIFTGLTFSFVGILQSFGEFNIPAIVSLVSNTIMIAYCIIFKDKFGVTGLAAAMLLGWAMQAVVQVPSLIKLGYRYSFDFNFADSGIKKATLLAVPMLISTWVQPIGSLVNIYFSSFLGEGVLSALEYANRLYIIVVGVFSFVVTNLVFPSMARASAAKDNNQSSQLIKSSLKAVSIVVTPLMGAFIVLSHPIVRLIYQRGAFDPSSTVLTATALTYYSMGMIGFALAEVLNKSFFAMQNSKTPMITSLVSIGANIFFSWLLSKYAGIAGLALATALGATLNAVLNFVFINKKASFINKTDAITFLKILVSALAMSASVWAAHRFLAIVLPDSLFGQLLNLSACTTLGIIIYVLACVTLKVNEIFLVFDIIKRKKRG